MRPSRYLDEVVAVDLKRRCGQQGQTLKQTLRTSVKLFSFPPLQSHFAVYTSQLIDAKPTPARFPVTIVQNKDVKLLLPDHSCHYAKHQYLRILYLLIFMLPNS